MTALGEVRPMLAAALEGGPWPVLADIPDAITPPALITAWANPWLEMQTSCNYRAAALVICVANRLTPGTGMDLLEQMVSYVILALATALRLPVQAIPGPLQMDIAGVTYLAARVPVVVPVNVAQPDVQINPLVKEDSHA